MSMCQNLEKMQKSEKNNPESIFEYHSSYRKVYQPMEKRDGIFMVTKLILWKFIYPEWAIIFMFISIFGMEITVASKLGNINFHPLSSDYVNLQTVATIINYEHNLLALFVLLCWLRVLKFLRIPKSTGPTVQSVMDTLTSVSVLVFVFIILFVIMVFSVSFHIAFGSNLLEYSTWPNSLYVFSIFLLIFSKYFDV